MKTHEYSQTEDNDVKKLQAFFNKLNPVLKESEFLFTFDGLHLCLYRDITEVSTHFQCVIILTEIFLALSWFVLKNN